MIVYVTKMFSLWKLVVNVVSEKKWKMIPLEWGGWMDTLQIL